MGGGGKAGEVPMPQAPCPTPQAPGKTMDQQPLLSSLDLYLFGEGRHHEIYKKLGAHLVDVGGVSGLSFACWAPNAAGVSVVGDFNGWQGRTHAMQPPGASGIWALFV